MNKRKLKFFVNLLIVYTIFSVNSNQQHANAFYVPGVAPQDFAKGDPVEVKGVKMTSAKTQLPYEFYNVPIHCMPPEGVTYKSENLGEILRGDRIVNTGYRVKMNVNEQCQVLCNGVKLSAEQSKKLAKRVKDSYHVHLLVDNLPCATKFRLLETNEEQYEHGYQLGFIKDQSQYYINNHIKFKLKYHTELNSELYRVVGFEVETESISRNNMELLDDNKCKIVAKNKNIEQQSLNLNGETSMYMTYEVVWERSEIPWASRWDSYLKMTDVQIHWFSIVNSLIVVFFLAGILSMIIIRSLRRDIAKYNREEEPVSSEIFFIVISYDL